MTIISVVAFVLHLLSDIILSNRKDYSSPALDFLRDIKEHKCVFADFNGISIRGMLHHLCVYKGRSDGSIDTTTVYIVLIFTFH